MSKSPKFIVVAGTSAGGIRAVEELVMQLTPGMDAAFFVVLHLSRKGIGEFLFQRLQKSTSLICKVANDGEAIEKGVIYLARPDNHLLVSQGRVIVGRGARENGWRPSINNLFRSAAASYNSRVIAIILTGMLDDGATGMRSVKRCGGTCIVQDPNEADYPDMPLSVLNTMEVDHVVSLSKMGALLFDIMDNTDDIIQTIVPADVQSEALIDERVSTRIDDISQFEKISVNCPDCGGGLYVTQKEPPTHYRCHVGHSYSERELLIRVSEVMENTFWTSLRMMEERRTILMNLHKKDLERGYLKTSERHLRLAKEMEVHIENLKRILFTATEVD
ncbi:chemotaxis protein CheB [Segetibacter aerophilus]|uniref:protein-glutamate methylesterase n=1 Tax=Segetibacter aerophilus TaxID=670293 RepID=A0A512BJ19_9BACT|nr:chemotaxis protein CheB [Segetibacter aerophilus]GEO11972.1 chemotaxis protein-glutamate methylesterase [Segetibacter aerophilus]